MDEAHQSSDEAGKSGGCWLAFLITIILGFLFYFMPGMPPRKGDWFGNIIVDLHTGDVLNTVPLGNTRNGHFKYRWFLEKIEDVDVANPIQPFTPEAKIGDRVSGQIIILDEQKIEYWRGPFNVSVLETSESGSHDTYNGAGIFGADIKLNSKAIRDKKLSAHITIDHIDHDAFTDQIGFKVSFFNVVPCRHFQCLLY